MRFSKRFPALPLLFLAVLNVGSSLAWGEPQLGRPRGSLGSPLELAQWEADIAENSYSIHKTDRNLSSLLGAYEKILQLTCMPELLKTLQYSGAPKDPTCLKYLDATLKIDRENPIAVCARDGIDSKSCEDAFLAQETETYAADNPLWPPEEGVGQDLDIQLESRTTNTAEISKLESELTRVQGLSQVSSENRAIYEPQVKAIMQKLVWATCRYPKLKVQILYSDANGNVPDQAPEILKNASVREQLGRIPASERGALLKELMQSPQSQNFFPVDESSTPRPMDDIVNALKPGNAPSAVRVSRVRPDGISRIRYISRDCLASVERASSSEAGGAAGACAQYGDYSPDCIRARRRDRVAAAAASAKRTPSAQKTAAPGANRNFSTF